MATKLRVYLDTSVLNAKIDNRDLGRQRLTELFWLRFDLIDPVVSNVVLQEIDDTPDTKRRNDLRTLTSGLTVLSQPAALDMLVRAYLSDGVFTPAMTNDAR